MRLVRLMTTFCAVAVASFLLASSSDATPIGPSCGTCQGSIYELSYSGIPIATNPGIPSGTNPLGIPSETFQITYTIDTSGYTGAGVKLDTVALKVASSFINADLVTAPGGVANWVEMSGGLNAAGCSGSGSGYDCVRIVALVNAPVVPGVTYTWIFNIEVPTGALFTGNDQASVKARYVSSNGIKKGALVSEGITLTDVPEPRLGLLLLALPSLALWRRTRQA
jgi:hypothetical protein